MAIQFVNNIDFNLNQAQEFVLENLASDPTAGNTGRLIYNTTSSKVKVDDGTAFVDISGDITEVAAGTYLNGGGTTGIVTLNHDLTSRSDTTSSSSPGYSGSFDVVDSVTSNTTGHITAINVKTVTLPAAEDYTWILTGDSGTPETINSGNTVDIQGGTNINTVVGSTDILTVNLDDSITLAGTLTVNGTGQSSFAGQVTIPTTPIAATDAASKGYVDSVVAGGLIYQGGYDASTNTPALDTNLNITAMGTGGGPLSGVYPATTTTGTGSGMTIYVVLNSAGNITTARVVDGGSGYTTGSTVSVSNAISGHSGSYFTITSVPISGIEKGWTYTVTADGYFYNEQVRVGDVLIAEVDAPTALGDWTTVQNNIDLASLTQVGIGNVNAGTGISVTYSNGTATVSKDVTNQSAKRISLTDVTSGISRAEAGGITTFTLDISNSTFFGAGAIALDVMVEVVGDTVNAGETVYAEIGRPSGTNMTVKFTGSIANGDYQVLLNYVA